ncbi:hypothetical protein DL98DRAFT_177564 [Cadophora sp. DSE1049]|nr:hypothetical protein DL98DRAFT_177564 [Cadophora sp. DSE1049]
MFSLVTAMISSHPAFTIALFNFQHHMTELRLATLLISADLQLLPNFHRNQPERKSPKSIKHQHRKPLRPVHIYYSLMLNHSPVPIPWIYTRPISFPTPDTISLSFARVLPLTWIASPESLLFVECLEECFSGMSSSYLNQGSGGGVAVRKDELL